MLESNVAGSLADHIDYALLQEYALLADHIEYALLSKLHVNAKHYSVIQQ